MWPLAIGLALGHLQSASAPQRPSAGFRLALPGYDWNFPRDDGAHPAYANEWWYFNGNLRTAAGKHYGFELTFFRISPVPNADLKHDLYFAHFAVSDLETHTFSFWTRTRRGEWSQAGVARDSRGLVLWNENWRAQFDATGPSHLQAVWGRNSVDLNLAPGKRTFNGAKGWSQKGGGRGQASYYYSLPHVEAHGTVQGMPAAGLIWMDHEFGSNPLAGNQRGWDWMGLHLPGADLLLFNLRLENGGRDQHSAGTYQPLEGPAMDLTADDFEMAPLRRWRGYPVEWLVKVPRLALSITVNAAFDDQLLHDPVMGISYWEGAVTLAGTRAGRDLRGEGYLELTGYDAPFRLLQSRP